MLLILITHADARRVTPPYIFRALTEEGRDQVVSASGRLRDLLPQIAPGFGEKTGAIGKIVSSPQARCVETVLLLADRIRDLTSDSEIHVSDRLKETDDGLRAVDLVSVITEFPAEAALICTHGDLAGALPANITLHPDHRDGWFASRPALVVIDYEQAEGWDGASVLACEVLKDSRWETALEH